MIQNVTYIYHTLRRKLTYNPLKVNEKKEKNEFNVIKIILHLQTKQRKLLDLEVLTQGHQQGWNPTTFDEL